MDGVYTPFIPASVLPRSPFTGGPHGEGTVITPTLESESSTKINTQSYEYEGFTDTLNITVLVTLSARGQPLYVRF